MSIDLEFEPFEKDKDNSTKEEDECFEKISKLIKYYNKYFELRDIDLKIYKILERKKIDSNIFSERKKIKEETHEEALAVVDMKIDGSWYRMFNQIEGYKIANKDFNKSLKDLGYYYKMVCGWSAGFYKIEKE